MNRLTALHMKKIKNKKTRKAFEEALKIEVFERYNCLEDLKDNINGKLHDKIIKLFEKHNVNIVEARATLKNLLIGMYVMEVEDELDFKI